MLSTARGQLVSVALQRLWLHDITWLVVRSGPLPGFSCCTFHFYTVYAWVCMQASICCLQSEPSSTGHVVCRELLSLWAEVQDRILDGTNDSEGYSSTSLNVLLRGTCRAVVPALCLLCKCRFWNEPVRTPCCFGNSMRCCNMLQSLQVEGVKLTAGIRIFTQADGG